MLAPPFAREAAPLGPRSRHICRSHRRHHLPPHRIALLSAGLTGPSRSAVAPAHFMLVCAEGPGQGPCGGRRGAVRPLFRRSLGPVWPCRRGREFLEFK
ncbi:hypothetical protein STRAU_0445 [Streptomyces aurantiacus JA 4570]|uniref:Uncharacterized protein n=1 Tax=Streptomyces aurantiacus JA 4570 TaxID=1286094 RepID=S3ZTF4_9ACTN|nr:hypothetical protein STRAU_0445 [Streptomyces aurantiacus JA 4570]